MGKRHSKPRRPPPPPPPPLDPLFTSIGCTGLPRFDYKKPRLDSAPFLFYPIEVRGYHAMYQQILQIFQTLRPDVLPEWTPPPPRQTEDPIWKKASDQTPSSAPTDPPVWQVNGVHDPDHHVFGPVYLFVAFDPEQGMVKAFLYFPSMTKEKKPWSTFHFLGSAHRWLYRLINGQFYYIPNPNSASACEFRIDDKSMKMGCKTENSGGCRQSEATHMSMGIYDPGKQDFYYPSNYFRTYRINLNDIRVRNLVNQNTFTFLQRNVLPADLTMFAGCANMLISPNMEYFYVITNSMLTLYHNIGREDVNLACMQKRSPRYLVPMRRTHFKGGSNSRMRIEGLNMRIYTDNIETGSEENVLTVPAFSPGAEPYAMVLTNEGKLVMYDGNNKVVSSDMFDQIENASFDEYDPVRDRKERMLQLIAYFKLLRIYKEIPNLQSLVEKTGIQQNLSLVFEQLDDFDSKQDYISRLETLLQALLDRKILREDDPNRYGFPLHLQDDGQDPTQGTSTDTESGKQPKSGSSPDSQKADPSKAQPGDECAVIKDDELRIKCMKDRETKKAEERAAADTSRRENEVALMSGEIDLSDVQEDMAPKKGSTDATLSSLNKSLGMVPASALERTKKETEFACPLVGDEYDADNDLYCRLQAIKKRFGKDIVFDEGPDTSVDDGITVNAEAASEYQGSADRQKRVQDTFSYYDRLGFHINWQTSDRDN